METRLYDCIIIGGGVGGLTLAIQLAEAKKSVLLFEKNKYPFHKVCGEYISMESRDFLQRIGFPFEKFTLPEMTDLVVSSPGGMTVKRKLDMGGFGISRYVLDEELAEIAKQKGAVVHDDTKVSNVEFSNEEFTVTANSMLFHSKLVCGAFGKKSNIDQLLSRKFLQNKRDLRKNYVGVKYHLETKFDPCHVELHNFKNGYCGMSQIENGLTNFTYITTSKNLRDNGNDIKQMEENVLKKNPFLKFYLENSKFIFKEPLVISNVTFNRKSAVDKYILMLGDSAGTIAPLCGNGMSMAMNASSILGQLIPQFLEGKQSRTEMEENYTREWNKLFKRRINAGRTIQHFFGNSLLTSTGVGLAKILPFFADQLLRLTHGKRF